jgi:hypothetical protein
MNTLTSVTPCFSLGQLPHVLEVIHMHQIEKKKTVGVKNTDAEL